MKNERLVSYKFGCPCCNEPHTRIFDYYAKFKGYIPEIEDLDKYKEVQMLERVVMNGEIYEERSLPAGDSTFRCGKCFEFFKFDDKTSKPRILTEEEKIKTKEKFKPIPIDKEVAVLNSVASFDHLINKYGCKYDVRTGNLVIIDDKNREITINIAEQLLDVFYRTNPNFEVRSNILCDDYSPMIPEKS